MEPPERPPGTVPPQYKVNKGSRGGTGDRTGDMGHLKTGIKAWRAGHQGTRAEDWNPQSAFEEEHGGKTERGRR